MLLADIPTWFILIVDLRANLIPRSPHSWRFSFLLSDNSLFSSNVLCTVKASHLIVVVFWARIDPKNSQSLVETCSQAWFLTSFRLTREQNWGCKTTHPTRLTNSSISYPSYYAAGWTTMLKQSGFRRLMKLTIRFLHTDYWLFRDWYACRRAVHAESWSDNLLHNFWSWFVSVLIEHDMWYVINLSLLQLNSENQCLYPLNLVLFVYTPHSLDKHTFRWYGCL